MQFFPGLIDLLLIALILLTVIEVKLYSAAKRHGLSKGEILAWMLVTPLLLLLPVIPFLVRLRMKRLLLSAEVRKQGSEEEGKGGSEEVSL